MLHHEALRQLTHDHQQQRRREAEAERLALQARGLRQRRRQRLALDAALGLLRRRHGTAPSHGA
ncbi:MAG: hypothetical protein ABIR67_03470 [Gaiellaceae bacterium]